MPEATRRGRTMASVERSAKANKVGPLAKRASIRANEGRIETTHTDLMGRMFIVYIDREGDDPSLGNIKGPMPLDSLNLPQPLMVRLHNELYARRLLTVNDVMRRPQDVEGAYKAALRLDVQSIQNLYRELAK